MSRNFSELTIMLRKSGDILELDLVGAITESSKFPELPSDSVTALKLNLLGIAHMNSGGVRAWMNWMTLVQEQFPSASLSLDHVPHLFNRHIATIHGFIPQFAKIVSIQMPYMCPNCETEEFHWFKHGVNYGRSGSESAIAKVKCPKCGTNMEFDDSEEYLDILGKFGNA